MRQSLEGIENVLNRTFDLYLFFFFFSLLDKGLHCVIALAGLELTV